MATALSMRCSCRRQKAVPLAGTLAAFSRVRERCPALRNVLVPDDVWTGFKDWHTANLFAPAGQNDAQHISLLAAALHRGHLVRATSPIHRFLLNGRLLRPEVTAQYAADLQERWMLIRPDGLGRHQKFRSFFGKLAELQLAEWLEVNGWKVTALEATGGLHDISATDRTGQRCAIQVKFLGATDEEFEVGVRALASGFAAHSPSPYQATNYLLFRLFEAAHQFDNAGSERRVAAIIVDAQMWYLFEVPLTHGWIDWLKPAFLTTVEPQPFPFLDKQRQRFPGLDDQLAATLLTLDEVWVLKHADCRVDSRELQIRLKS